MRKLFNNNLFLKILSVLIAIILWLFVLYTVKPTTQKVYKDIPVSYKGEYVLDNAGLAIVKDTPLTATVELKGARVDLAKISAANITVSATVSDIAKSGEYTLDYTVKVDGNNITVLSVSPNSGKIDVEKKAEADIPLSVTTTGARSDENEVLSPELSSETIHISGPKSRIESITKAVASLDQSHVSDGEQMELPYVFYDKDGHKIDQTNSIATDESYTRVICHLLYKRAVPVYPIVSGKTAEGSAIDTMTASPKNVTLIGPRDTVEALTHIETEPIKLAGQEEEKTYQEVALSLPEDITFYKKKATDDDPTVDITIKTGASTTQTIPITYLETKDSADQSNFTFENGQLSISVSGTAANIQNAEIHAVIDIAGLSVGEHTVPVTITTTGPYLTVSGDYTATIQILT